MTGPLITYKSEFPRSCFTLGFGVDYACSRSWDWSSGKPYFFASEINFLRLGNELRIGGGVPGEKKIKGCTYRS